MFFVLQKIACTPFMTLGMLLLTSNGFILRTVANMSVEPPICMVKMRLEQY